MTDGPGTMNEHSFAHFHLNARVSGENREKFDRSELHQERRFSMGLRVVCSQLSYTETKKILNIDRGILKNPLYLTDYMGNPALKMVAGIWK